MAYEPKFRYWTVRYTYPDGTEIRQGAYADKSMADMNARLNNALTDAGANESPASVEEVWY